MSIKTKRNIQILVNLVFGVYLIAIPSYMFSNDFKYSFNLVLGILMVLAGLLLGVFY